jgi:DNA-binding winged helix-turn-helix (wHTH) protein
MILTVQAIAGARLRRSSPLSAGVESRASSDTLDLSMTDGRPARRYRFGVFEADAATGELRRQGIRVKLNTQPFQLLCLLLERPGDLLTREEICRELWPEGTFVDYEHGVNSAINRIREALGDTAASPRFVETLARRGYRFVAPVERIAGTENPPSSSAELVARPVPDNPSLMEARPSSEPAEPPVSTSTGILATPHELPKLSNSASQTLFILFQVMYLSFYIGALANLAEIEDLFSALTKASQWIIVLIVSAAVLIPVRAFVLCAVLLHAPGVREKFLKLWPALLVFDELWALAPFLLLHHINFGLALACTALLAWAPFVQRSLVLMGAGSVAQGVSAQVR